MEKESCKYSVIVPVYNRPEEVDELLASLAEQSFKDFEVVVVEDGSSNPCGQVVEKYEAVLDISYHFKENTGPGQSRNYGADRTKGEYLIILDSDVTVPPGYFEAIEKELSAKPCDAFGGPDREGADFTPVQKAISYAMTSFYTTGGIRGGSEELDKFHPRSFNMGIRKSVFLALGGFCAMRFGEDIDLSIRIFKEGYSCRLFPEAWVYHKRRTDLAKFFRQVHNSGIARINLYKKYPDTLKPVHVLPALFTVTEKFGELRPYQMRRVMKYKDAEPEVVSCDDVGCAPERCGFAGSPTNVNKIMSVVLAGGAFREIPATDEGIAGLVGELVADHTIG